MTDECQLFLSKRLVTETKIFDGGVLVDERGVIVDVLERNEAEKLITQSKGKLKVTDGGDWALIAGVVDSHVHVNEPGRTAWEGFRTATNAAAAGGITTIVDMPLNSIPPTTTLENLKTKVKSATGHVYVDVGFWGGVIVGNQDSLRDLVKAGVVGFKCFLCPSGVDEFPNVGAEDLELAFNALEGTGSVLAFHAELEDDCPDDKTTNKQDPEEYNTYLESRPPKMELNAISLITSFLERTEYEMLWKCLLDDKLDLVVSDHSPCTPDLKCSNNLEAWGGISSVQFGLSLFWTQASTRGLDLRAISKYLSNGPANLCGLQNRKGALKKGLDADLVYFAPDETFVIKSDIIRHKNKLTPYIGKELKGVVKKTYVRGQLVFAEGDIVGEPKGKLLIGGLD
ncbi:jg9995 [Pararge aegeria aegeria]|uniref:Jg9995 protein n=1 Tax=Pararge aegeria aegeria TaxID=348720 RepID=A0A8S4SCS5_9NEOP|nr:jg9995 [Pararge aegeria aegeria]